MSTFDPRPEVLHTVTEKHWDELSEMEQLQYMKKNPSLSMVELERKYESEHWPVDAPVPPTEMAQHVHVDPQPETVTAPPQTAEVVKEPVTEQPTKVEEVVTPQPTTPAAEEPKPEVHDNMKASEEVPPLRETFEDITLRTVPPSGKPIIGNMEENDNRGVYLFVGELVGPERLGVKEGATISEFLNGLIYDPRTGEPKFRTEEEGRRNALYSSILNNTPPYYHRGDRAGDEATAREDAKWNDGFEVDGRKYPIMQSIASTDTSTLGMIRKRTHSGIPITLKLVHSGIVVSMISPHEEDFCDLDMRIARRITEVGMQTFGMLMNTASGAYIQELVEFALDFVTDATIDTGGRTLRETLLDVVDERDYWILLSGVMQSMFPTGIPWALACLSPECGNERPVTLNVARAIRVANNLLTENQRRILYRYQSEPGFLATPEVISAYRKDFKEDKSDFYEDDIMKIKFKTSSLREFFTSTASWIDDLGERVRKTMAEDATEEQRNRQMSRGAEQRRLTRYIHRIEYIAYKDENGVLMEPERRPDQIKEILRTLSPNFQFAERLEAAVAEYNERHRLAIFGYYSSDCPVCGQKHGEKEGTFRGFITLSPDRVFFTLSRVVSEIQRQYASQYENIG